MGGGVVEVTNVLGDLLVAYTGHYQGDISLDIDGEVLHEGNKWWPGCYVDAAINLEVQEVGALEHMVFVSEGATGTEAAGTLLPGCVGVPA